MMNQLPNSEYWHHQMQLAAMTRTIKECYRPRAPVSGFVLVSCCDGTVRM
jgi:phosphatidylserine decarboxylase